MVIEFCVHFLWVPCAFYLSLPWKGRKFVLAIIRRGPRSSMATKARLLLGLLFPLLCLPLLLLLSSKPVHLLLKTSSITPTTSYPVVATPSPSSSAASGDTPVPVLSRSAKKIALARKAAAACQPGPSSVSYPPRPSLPTVIGDDNEEYMLLKKKNIARGLQKFSCCGAPLIAKEEKTQRKGLWQNWGSSVPSVGSHRSFSTPMTKRISRSTPGLC